MSWTGWRLKSFFTAGAIFWIFSGAAMFVLPSMMHNWMYLFSVTIGIANALMMVCPDSNKLFTVSVKQH